MTLTLTSPPDGSSDEVLAVPSSALSGTSITASYSGGVLTLSGLANTSAYQTALEAVTYDDSLSSPTAGNRTVSVLVNDGTNNSVTGTTATATVNVTSVSAVPTVTELSPTTGPATGDTTVTVTGTGFTGATAVDFGATAATSVTVNSATQITATSPAGTGAVDVTVAAPAAPRPLPRPTSSATRRR